MTAVNPPGTPSGCFWDRLSEPDARKKLTKKTWVGLEAVGQNHNYLMTGDRDSCWLRNLGERHFEQGQAGDVLMLGCGDGSIEHIFKERGFHFKSLTGIDINEKCIQLAESRNQKNPLAPKVEYAVRDLNTYRPPRRSYDLIIFYHSLHHVWNQEQLLQACARALRPRGRIMLHEYVGPSRFQWPDEQLAAVNAVFTSLPKELRMDAGRNQVISAIERPTVEMIEQIDETEAVRSEDIEILLRRYFRILEEKNWGGTILHLVFGDTIENYDQSNAYHEAIIELLIQYENALIGNGALSSDFKFYLVRPKTLIHWIRSADKIKWFLRRALGKEHART